MGVSLQDGIGDKDGSFFIGWYGRQRWEFPYRMVLEIEMGVSLQDWISDREGCVNGDRIVVTYGSFEGDSDDSVLWDGFNDIYTSVYGERITGLVTCMGLLKGTGMGMFQETVLMTEMGVYVHCKSLKGDY